MKLSSARVVLVAVLGMLIPLLTGSPVQSQVVSPPAAVPHSAAAGSQPWWGPPEPVATTALPNTDSKDAGLAVRGREALAVWNSQTGILQSARQPDHSWSPPAVLAPKPTSSGLSVTTVALGPGGAAQVLWTETNSATYRTRLWERHREGGVWSTPVRIGRGGDANAVIDQEGLTTVAWVNRTGLHIITRLPGGNWSARHNVATGPFVSWTRMYSNRTGTLAVAWDEQSQGLGVVVRRDGHWGHPTVLPSAFDVDNNFTPFDAAISRRGRVLVVWGDYEESVLTQRRYLAWARTRPDGTWGRVRYLPTTKPVASVDRIDLAMNPAGKALLTVQVTPHDGPPVRWARFEPGNGWSRLHAIDSGRSVDPVASLNRSGLGAIVLTGGKVTWGYQRPGRPWSMMPTTMTDTVSVDQNGRQTAILYLSPALTYRALHLPH